MRFPSDDAGDQKAADDEKDVDAKKACRQPCRPGVRQDDGRDRNCPQAVDFSSVIQGHFFAAPGVATFIAYTVSARSLRDPRKRNRAEILQAKGGFPRERNTISELILRKSYYTSQQAQAWSQA
ncbi:hypothetical protein M2321_002259 [Rhodoblastus acidophilus]|uniref:hypothetical protein n=1 Tax=Rhodoblastus acidophilus TaxID=1074 RepID=UPI001FF018D4|nr:hypothetical protein [Rhodoblastus acidophilus]MCW2274681.1 hypothetical protein [Rhodoblastus acidophilus]